MTTLHANPIPVQSDPAAFLKVDPRIARFLDACGLDSARPEPEPFHPSAEDLALDLARAMGIDEAEDLGFALGLDSEISEPPGGYSDEEKAAYRRGFVAGELARDERLDLMYADTMLGEPLDGYYC